MKKDELIFIRGGGSDWLSATFLNAIVRGLNTILEIGRSLGTAIIRTKRGNSCE